MTPSPITSSTESADLTQNRVLESIDHRIPGTIGKEGPESSNEHGRGPESAVHSAESDSVRDKEAPTESQLEQAVGMTSNNSPGATSLNTGSEPSFVPPLHTNDSVATRVKLLQRAQKAAELTKAPLLEQTPAATKSKVPAKAPLKRRSTTACQKKKGGANEKLKVDQSRSESPSSNPGANSSTGSDGMVSADTTTLVKLSLTEYYWNAAKVKMVISLFQISR